MISEEQYFLCLRPVIKHITSFIFKDSLLLSMLRNVSILENKWGNVFKIEYNVRYKIVNMT